MSARLELLVEAAYTRNKEVVLQQANLRLEVLRHLWCAAQQLHLVPTRPYEHGACLLDDLGGKSAVGSRVAGQPVEVMNRLGGIWRHVVSFENLLSRCSAQ